ncbi:MAG TPA: DUF4349 domain-containing protein [Gaiellaceae bacterium]
MSQHDVTTGDLIAELRAARIPAPPELRERVRMIAGSQPSHSRFTLPSWFTLRRALVVALPVAAAVAATLVVTLPSHKQQQPTALSSQSTLRAAKVPQHGSVAKSFGGATALVPAPAVPTPSPTRAQRYGASLTLRLATSTDVSNGVKRALRIASSLGGYSTSVHASTKGRTASATLVLKVPRTHVQQAVAQLSALGTITAEQVDVQDVQTGLNVSDRTIARLQRQLHKLRAETQTASVRHNIATITARVQRLQRQNAASIRAARYATVDLRLATPAVAAQAPHRHGPLHGLGVAFHWIGIGAVYAFALGAPLAALIALAWLAARAIRRRRENELLSRR